MKRLEYSRYGGPELMRVAPFVLPEPGAHEIAVRVTAASINPMDWKIRNGDMKFLTGRKFPRGMGADFSGVVEAVGDGVTEFEPGDAVLGSVPMKRSGAFATALVTTPDLVVRKPASLSFEAAATLPIAACTAWQALVKAGGLRRGHRVFINGASGAVGQAAVAIARSMGAEVAGRVGPASLDHAQSLGLSRVLDHTRPLPADLSRTFDIVFDVHGSLSAAEGNALVRRGGKVIDITPTRAKFVRALVSPSRKVVIADVGASHLQAVVDLAVTGKLSITIGKTVSLDSAPQAIAALERGDRVNGKVVIKF